MLCIQSLNKGNNEICSKGCMALSKVKISNLTYLSLSIFYSIEAITKLAMRDAKYWRGGVVDPEGYFVGKQ